MSVKLTVLACFATVCLGVHEGRTVDSDDTSRCSGFIVTRDGRTIHFLAASGRSTNLRFKYEPELEDTEVPVTRIREVRFGPEGKTAIITLKDNRQVRARYYMWMDAPHWNATGNAWEGASFSYRYFDQVQRAEKNGGVKYADVSLISFGDAVGRYRCCPHCKAVWPDSYLFCPHDGTGTVWGELNHPIPESVTQPASENRAKEQVSLRNANLLDALLNASLARSGIDPASDHAKKAKEIGKLWMNPRASDEEIQRELTELRQELLRKSGDD